MSEIMTKSCPNCGNKLMCNAGDATVTCYACDSVFEVSELTGERLGAVAAAAAIPAMVGFDNPESGIVFLENFFDTYDWATYKKIAAIEIPEIAGVIATNKMKNGAAAASWYLDFQGLYVPVSKKFEALDECAAAIGKNYDPVDGSEILSTFDDYRRVAKGLKDNEEAVLKALASAIKYAERFGLDAAQLNEMKAGLEKATALFAAIPVQEKKSEDEKTRIIDTVEALPAYLEARKEYSKKKVAAYQALGIDAEAVYKRAVDLYNNSDNKGTAIELFESIREYADSSVYISRANRYFNFNNKMYSFFGKYFVYKEEIYDENALDVKEGKKKKKKKGEEDAEVAPPTTALSLYPVIDGKPAKEPIVKGIEQVIACYGSRFYYFKKGAGIACYDIYSKIETVVDHGKATDYAVKDGRFMVGFSKKAPIFFIQKKVGAVEQPKPEAAAADEKGKKAKKAKAVKAPILPAAEPLNPYALVGIDMAGNGNRVLINEMLEIALRKGDKIFYKHVTVAKPQKPGFLAGCFGKKIIEEKPKSRLMVCDIVKGSCLPVLDDDCDIQDVSGENIVYTCWTPNSLNMDLYVFNIEKSEKTLIEKNIYNFYGLNDGKIYYTIGNSTYQPLVSNNFAGTDREQIMANVEKIVGTYAGWLYVKKGSGINSVLVKISSDGKETKVLCTQFKRFLRFAENYAYYIDVFDNLRVVRVDGEENKVLASNVAKVFLSEEGLYYVREELVDDYYGTKNLSLYMMDKNGLNVRKIVFDLDVLQDDPASDDLYYSKKESMRYKVYKPKKPNDFVHEIYVITKFYKMNKVTGVSELVLTLGLPEDVEKKGCFGFGKPKKVDLVYEEDPIVHSYKTRGLNDAQIAQKEADEAPVEKKAPGCSKMLDGVKGKTGGLLKKIKK